MSLHPIRVSIEDRHLKVMQQFPTLSHSAKLGILLDTLFPEHMGTQERGERMLAMIEGRLLLTDVPARKD